MTMHKFDPTGPKSKEQLERIYREVSGVNPGNRFDLRDEEQQRIMIAKAMQVLMQRTDPLVMMSMLVVALGFMADEHNVNRGHLCDLLREARQNLPVEVTIAAPKTGE